MTKNVISGKRGAGFSAEEKRVLRNALHTEACLTGDYGLSVNIRQKLGLAPLAFERDEEAA